MSTPLVWLDRRLSIVALILSFWACYWILNGADEFFNGTQAPNTAVTAGVVHDAAGNALHKLHPLQPIGWYGISQAPRFIAYFGQLGLPPAFALSVLYALSVAQLALGALFLFLLARRNRALADLAFKAAMLVFVLLSVLDILFGDRQELWHHGTYLALTLITYDLWYQAERYHHTRALLGVQRA